MRKDLVPLRPAMALISHVAHVKWVDAGTPVSYGGTFVTERRTKIVTVPVGYGDGYPRSLSNRGWVLIHGKKAPILGRICMDQFMVDATGIEDVRFGDEVTLVGHDGDEYLSVDTLQICPAGSAMNLSATSESACQGSISGTGRSWSRWTISDSGRRAFGIHPRKMAILEVSNRIGV